MSYSFQPNWTDIGTELISPRVLALNYNKRATLDLRTVVGAWLYLAVGKSGVTVPTNGYVIVRRTLNNNGLLAPGSAYFSATIDLNAAIVKQVNNAAGYAAGVSDMIIDGTGTPVWDDAFVNWGTASDPTGLANDSTLSNAEWLRCSRWNSSTNVISWDAPVKKAVSDNYYLVNKAGMWSVWCSGGATYEVIFDYTGGTAGQNLAIAAWTQTYTNDVTV